MASTKTYFLSHSSTIKPLVQEVANALGEEACWLDAWDLHAGDELLDVIDEGIAASTVFAIFWSAGAATSPWVKEELGQARYRKLRQNNVKILPIKVDDTPMPAWLERLRYINAEKGASIIASELRTAAEGKPLLRTDGGGPDPAFQNRQGEADTIEAAYADEALAGVLVAGPPGMGKSALCKWVLAHRLPHLRSLWVDIERASTPTLFFAVLAEQLDLRLPSHIAGRGDWNTYWGDWILPALNPESDCLVVDGLHAVLDADGSVPDWLLKPLTDVAAGFGPNRLPLAVVTGRVAQLPPKLGPRLSSISLSRLTDADVIRALRVRLRQGFPRRTATESQLDAAARIVHGYPLGAQLWAAHAAQVGVDLAVLDPTPVTEQVQEVVADMLSTIKRTEKEDEALLTLALLRFPVGLQDVVSKLKVSAPTLTALQRSLLLDPSADGLALHGIVAKHLVEKFSAHASVRTVHERLGRFFLAEWRDAPEDLGRSAFFGSQAYYHLLAAGRTDEAATVGWSLAEEAKAAIGALYRMRQVDTVLEVGDSLIGSMGDAAPPDVYFYVGLAYGRRANPGDEEHAAKVFKHLLDVAPENRFYWSGYADTLQRFGDLENARDAYMRARALSKSNDPTPSLRLGELLLRTGRIEEAEPFLKEAYLRAKADLQVVAGYASLLERKGQFSEALGLVRQGLQRRADDIGLNHRAGQILREMGKKTEALSYLSKAAKGTASPASYTSLADLYLDMGRTKDAAGVMDRFPGPRDSTYYNVMGNIARREERFLDAEKHFDRCAKAGEKGVVLRGSMAHLRLAQAKKAIEGLAFEAARAYLLQADEEIRRGLELDPANVPLLSLKNDSDSLRSTVVHRTKGR